MKDLKFSELIDYLLSDIPEIDSYYNAKAGILYANGNVHVSYGSIFVNFLKDVCEKADPDSGLIDRLFAHIESLASSSDFEVRCVAYASVLESLIDKPSNYHRYNHRLLHNSSDMAYNIYCQLRDIQHE